MQIGLSWIIFVIMIAVLLEVLQQHLDEMERSGEATAALEGKGVDVERLAGE